MSMVRLFLASTPPINLSNGTIPSMRVEDMKGGEMVPQVQHESQDKRQPLQSHLPHERLEEIGLGELQPNANKQTHVHGQVNINTVDNVFAYVGLELSISWIVRSF